MRDGLAHGGIPVWGQVLPGDWICHIPPAPTALAPALCCWPGWPAQASEFDPPGTRAAHSFVAHRLCICCVQALGQELERDGADMAPTREHWRSQLDPTCPSSIRVCPASWLGPQCPLPSNLHVLPQPYSFLSHAWTLSLPTFAQAGPSARNALSIQGNSTIFQAQCKQHIPRRLLNKHESLSPSSGISGCLCDEGLSSPQGCELPTGRAWVTSEVPGPGMQPSG